MEKNRSLDTLPEIDYTAIQEIVFKLHQCADRQSLKAIFESCLLPILEADSALYAWIDPDLLSPQLIDCINIPENEILTIKSFINKDPKAGYLLTHPYPIIARDINLPKKYPTENADPFFKEEPKIGKGYSYFSTSQKGVITLALRDSSLGAGIHRKLPCKRPWTVRDVRILELLRPHLLMSIKTIVLTEELSKQKSLVEVLSGSKTALALIDRDFRISFCNRALKELLHVENGQGLPDGLRKFLRTKQAQCKPPYEIQEDKKDSIYKLPEGNFFLSCTLLKGENSGETDSWLLQMTPLIEPEVKMGDILQKAGLTKREIEACLLIRQGMDSEEIADCLFISPYTVKTHLKKIHQKLGVHTRTQLVAALNRY